MIRVDYIETCGGNFKIPIENLVFKKDKIQTLYKKFDILNLPDFSNFNYKIYETFENSDNLKKELNEYNIFQKKLDIYNMFKNYMLDYSQLKINYDILKNRNYEETLKKYPDYPSILQNKLNKSIDYLNANLSNVNKYFNTNLLEIEIGKSTGWIQYDKDVIIEILNKYPSYDYIFKFSLENDKPFELHTYIKNEDKIVLISKNSNVEDFKNAILHYVKFRK